MIACARPSTRWISVSLLAVLLSAAGCASSTKQDTAAPGKAAIARSTAPTSAGSSAGSSATIAPATAGSAVAAPGRYAVGALQKVYVDRSRKTQKNRSAPEKPERTLPTLTLYPAQGSPGFETQTIDARPEGGPWPLVVFSHGVTGNGPAYATTLRVLASAGYVVVAPDYPLSKAGAEGGPSISDVAEQTRDIAFLIDQFLAASKATSGPLAGLIDPDRIGIAGHSLGAITSLGAGYNACCADPRIKAVAVWAGIFFPLESKGKVAPSSKGRPLLLVHGTADRTVNYKLGQAVYRLLGPPKYFITLPGAGHVPSYIQGVGTPQSKVVTLGTIDFFDRYLKGDRSGIARMHRVVASAGPAAATEQEQVG